MKDLPPKDISVLGIAASSRGFGFALMVGPSTLVDWGVKPVKSGDKNERSLSNFGNLIDRYKPNVLGIEDIQGSRRGARVQVLIEEIVTMAEGENIEVKRFSRQQMSLKILRDERGTKHSLAEHLAARFPEELSFRLPRKRRLWTSEDYQMDIFQAVALAQCSVDLLYPGPEQLNRIISQNSVPRDVERTDTPSITGR